MEDLTFRLEGVVHVKDDLEDFEGPLNLILLLLSKNKIEIKDIKISEILEQYIEYLDEMKKMDLEVASEFVTMASHLVYIKTKTLLAAEDEETTELQMLINSLEELKHRDCYSSIKAVIGDLEKEFLIGRNYIVKQQEPFIKDHGYSYSHDKSELLAALKDMFEKTDLSLQTVKPQSVPIPKAIIYSVSQKSEEIINRLKSGKPLAIRKLFAESRSRSELVAAFISILELCKVGSIWLNGSDEEMTVNYIGDPYSEENGQEAEKKEV